MEVLFVFTAFCFAIWIIRNIIFWVALWQLKEYRFDRVSVHLRETRQGRQLLFSPLSLAKWAAFYFYIFVIFDDSLLPVFANIVAAIYIVQAVVTIREFLLKIDKKPVFTFKAILMLLAPLCIVSIMFLVPLFDKFFWLLFLDRIVSFLVAFFVFVLSFPTEIHRDLQVQKAKEMLAARQKNGKKVLIIGLTGSYGKSSTKEYVAQILSSQFNVLSTKGTNNTPIGIARTILRGLNAATEIFVVEMGAYGRGEIAEMADIVKPEIGVLTAVNEQHLALFGSVQNTMHAKYELIEALPKNGLALFNGNNENTVKLYNHTKKPKVLYTVAPSTHIPSEVYADAIVMKRSSVEFTVHIGKTAMHFTAPLLGAHTIQNMIPGIYIAHHIGMKPQDIKQAVMQLVPIEKTMMYQELSNGVTVIDDTFNANPEAVIAAVNYMQIYKKQKILVMQPMIELGKQTNPEHYRVAKHVSTRCDLLLVTNTNYIKAIQNGIKDGKGKCQIVTGNAAELAMKLAKETRTGAIIVFEGKESYFVLEKYKEQTQGPKPD